MNRTPLQELIEMSAYAGARFDLVQAGGGNTSVKYDDNKMYIKASGCLLSEISENKGHTTIELDKTLAILDDNEIISESDKRAKDAKASQKLQQAISFGGSNRPSIETYLHALLLKYTCHVHAISTNIFTSQKNWMEKMKELDENALCIRYETPGIELALEMKAQLEVYTSNFGHLPKVIFLQNHGLIITSDTYEEIELLMEAIVIKAEAKAGIDFSRYRNTTKLAKCFNTVFGSRDIAYLSEDHTIYELLNSIDREQLKPFSPDGYVFCGYTLLEMATIQESDFKKYKNLYFEPPKLILYNNLLYIMAADLKKAKMIEDVFKNNLLIIISLGEDLKYLEDEEIRYLSNWEAEKYRQELP
jgi:rhamnose utilization protein RhaD (predicted bifunctional aldolase and dehydrogenase)